MNFSYPGQPCVGDNSCFTGVCTGGKCPGANVNETCSANSQCLLGLYCAQGTDRKCQPQREALGVCVNDEECVNSHGCQNGVCTPYFSLKDGVTVVGNPKWSLCASGQVDTANVCRTRTNAVAVTTPCTAPCSYVNVADNSTAVEPNSCLCANNASGNKYCQLANGKLYL